MRDDAIRGPGRWAEPRRARPAARRAARECGLAAVLLLAVATAEAAEPWMALKALRRVALEVTVEPEHPRISPEDLERRLDETLRQGLPVLRLDPQAPDVLRFTVSVRPVSGNELRGFYLPFSGTYGLGLVRLALERQVTVPGLAQPVPAVVWQAERLVRGGYSQSDTEAAAHLEELAEVFLADYRRAAGGS